MTAGFTELLTKQVALTGVETDLGSLFGESTGKIRLSVPDAATSSVWLGKKGVSTSDDEYKKGTQTQLPTTSLRGWYAITNGASVTVTITVATGGVDAPDWITAGTNGSSSGGGGGGTVAQGTGNTANPWTMQGVNGGAGERLATQADQVTTNSKLDALSAQLPTSLGAKPTANSLSIAFPSDFAGFQLAAGTNWAGKFIIGDGTNTVVVLNSPPGGSEYGLGTRAIGNTATTNAAASQVDGHSATIGATSDADTADTLIGRAKKIVSLLAGGLPAALGAGGGLKVDGSGTALPVETELPAAAALADNVANPTVPSIGAFISVYDPNASPPWQRARGSAAGGVWVQGAVGNGAAWSGIEKPQLMAGADSAGGGNKRVFLTDTSGRQVVVGPGASTAATSVSTVDAIATTNTVGPISAAASGTLKASAGRLRSFRVEGVSIGTYYLQIHDAASTGAISAGTIKGLGYEISGSGDEFVVQFAAPISFTTGISWAISSTKNTYTASASTAFVEGIWE